MNNMAKFYYFKKTSHFNLYGRYNVNTDIKKYILIV